MAASLSAALLVAVGQGAASAVEDLAPTASEAVAAIADIPTDGMSVADDTVADSKSPADISDDAADAVVFPQSSVRVSVETDGSVASSTRDGMTVFLGSDTGASTVAQPTDQGVRLMTVTDAPSSDGVYGFGFHSDGTTSLVVKEDGAVDVNSDGTLVATAAGNSLRGQGQRP